MNKNVKLLILSFIIVSLFSCSYNDEIIQVSQNLNLEKILSLKTNEQQIIAFKMLSDYEKLEIWKLKYNKLKNNNYKLYNGKKMSKNQVIILNELFRSLKLKYFLDKNSEEAKIYFYSYLPKMKEKALKYFNQRELKTIFSSLDTKIMSQQLPDINCGCSITYDWCGSGSTCTLPCTETTTWGCGWWIAEACNGACGTITINY
ncbi:MAG: bacteriocin fulvocin C-related protein [Flavobacteriaceae bacterium]